MKSPLIFQILSDGNTISDLNTRVWRSDTNTHSQTIFGIMDPSGARKLVRSQIGAYIPSTSGANVDSGQVLGSDPARVASAVFANYLSLIGGNALSSLYNIVPQGSLGSDLDQILLFG